MGRFLLTHGTVCSIWKDRPGTKWNPGLGLELGGNDSPLASDRPNSLWANQEHGVVHFDIEHDRVTHVERYTEKTLGSERAYFIMRDRHGLIWLGLDSGAHVSRRQAVAYFDSTGWSGVERYRRSSIL